MKNFFNDNLSVVEFGVSVNTYRYADTEELLNTGQLVWPEWSEPTPPCDTEQSSVVEQLISESLIRRPVYVNVQ